MFNIKNILYLFVFTLLISGNAMADKGEEAYQQGRELGLQSGDTEANSKRAAEAFQQAVDAGHLRAHNELAMMYLKGQGVSKDPQKARQLFKAAAENGLAISQYQLAELLRKGEGGDPDIDEAMKWYERAAGQRHVGAMSRLGGLYAEDNEDIEPDYPRAYAWYVLAKEYGGFVSNGKLEIIERRMGRRGMDKVKKLIHELAPEKESRG